MQKLKKSKGFTLTELAIVIAVIAILIAVLVPTFVSLINNANESADKQTVKNLNTALSVDEAINGKPEYLCEVRKILEEAGYNPTPTAASNDSAMYWYKTDNRVLLVKEDTVSFPAEYEGITVSDTTADSSTAKQAASVKLTASSVISISWSELIELDTTAFVHSTGYGTDGCCPACGEKIAATASEASSSDDFEIVNGALRAYNGSGGVVVIPANVTAIGERTDRTTAYYPFQNNTNVTSVIVSDNVTSIYQKAFEGCTSLTSVVIGNGVTNVQTGAFSKCASLTNVIIGDGVETIESAFSYCSSLKTITIGKSVNDIDEGFSSCPSLEAIYVDSENETYTSIDGNLYSKNGTILYRWALNASVTSVVIPDGVVEIGSFALAASVDSPLYGNYVNTTLTSITIPDSVTTIGQQAFQYCQALKNITIPNSVTSSIGDRTFYSCKALESITIPDGVTGIGEKAFSYCESLKTVIIGNSVKTIGVSAFSECTLITSINIPDSVETIYKAAFSGTQITSISIGAKVKTLESSNYSAFDGMLNLKEIKLDSKNENYTLIDGVLYNYAGTSLICYPSAKEGTEYTISDNVTKIYYHAFNSCNNLEKLIIGDNITTLSVGSSGQILDCDNIKSLTVGASFDFGSVSKNAYVDGKIPFTKNFAGLEEIIVDEKNENYQSIDGVLYTKNLSDGSVVLLSYPIAKSGPFTIPDGVTEIGYYAFCDCDNLTVNNGKDVTKIRSKAFNCCEDLIFNAVTETETLTINGNAFFGCTGKIIFGNNAKISSSNLYVSSTGGSLAIYFASAGVWSIGSTTTETVDTVTNYYDLITTTYSGKTWTYKSASE